MKTLKKLLLITVLGIFVFSCKKDDDEKNPSDYSFSSEDADVNKAKVEDAGQLLVTEMKAMENVEAIPALEAFGSFGDQDDPFEVTTMKSAPVFRTISAVATVTTGENSLSYLTQLMKADVTEDLGSIQEVFDEYKGIYTWDLVNKTWTKTTSTTEFKFIFPSTKTGTTNDATLVITYTGKTGSQPLTTYEGDLPTSFNATITVSDKKVFEVSFKASYDGDGLPTSVNYFVAVYPFKYEISWTYSSSSVSLRYQLTNDSENILDCFGKVGGDFSLDNILKEDNGETDVFYNGSAYFQIFDVKLAGDIDYKALYDAQVIIDESNLDELEADTALAVEVNKYVNLDLVFASSKQKIASAVAVPVVKNETYYDYTSNTMKTRKTSDLKMKLIFSADDSPVDLTTYFNTGFQDLINDLNSFIVELNNEYEADLGGI